MVDAKTTGLVLPPMERAPPASPAGTGHDVTTRARPVPMGMAVGKHVHDAGITRPATQKLGGVGAATPDGRDPGVHAC